jgi:hypothetical protein
MNSEIMHQIVEMMESEAHSRPSPIEFEMAYQARVAIDRIRFAVKHAEQFSKPCDQMREASLHLLEALDRLECLDRRFQACREPSQNRNRSSPDAQSRTVSSDKEGGPLMNHRTQFELDPSNPEPSRSNGTAEATQAGHVAENRTATVTTNFGPRLLDTRQVAEMLSVSESWVRDHSRPQGPEPCLPAMKFGAGKTAVVSFHPSDVLAFIDEQRQNGRSRGTGHTEWRN